jgi:enamine deaminase RidA (YjgF/YER057c/UK114 family)
MKQILEPADWAPPRGYSNGIVVSGPVIFLGGQIGWNAQQVFEASDFLGQARQALKNIVRVLQEAQAGPEHLVRLTWYVLDMQEYRDSLKALGAIYREEIGRHFPVMTCVQVSGFVEPQARLEIEATAVLTGG